MSRRHVWGYETLTLSGESGLIVLARCAMDVIRRGSVAHHVQAIPTKSITRALVVIPTIFPTKAL
jgi:hypothetical protein